MQEGQQDEQKQRSLLRDVINGALESAYLAVDVPATMVDGLVDAVGDIPHPGVDQVAKVVGKTLETAGEGTKEAAEHAGKIAESIVEGISNLDLNI